MWRLAAYGVLCGLSVSALGSAKAFGARLSSSLGSYGLVWDESRQVISLSTQDASPRVFWQSMPFASMVRVAQAENDIDFARGCFVFKEKKRKDCGAAKFLSFEARDDGAIWRGNLPKCNLDFEFRLHADDQPDALTFALELKQVSQETNYNRVRLSISDLGQADVYGFGHQYDRSNMRGKKLPIWAMEQGVGRGQQPLSSILKLPGVGGGCQGDWYTSYTAVPFMMTPAGTGILLDNREYLEFDFTQKGQFSFDVWGESVRGRIFIGTGPRDVLHALTERTGRMGELPEWSQQGLIQRVSGGSDKVRKLFRTLKQAGVALGALWIEDWVGTRKTSFGDRMWWNWEVDRELYPDWEALVAELRAQDVRVLIYFNPFLTDAAEKPGLRRNLYREAKERGLLMRNSQGEVYEVGNGGFTAGILDLTQADTRALIKDIMHEQLRIGVSGWMADFGEALPIDSINLEGRDAYLYHNEYPLAWAKLNAEVLAELDPEHRKEVLYFSRSGNAESPGFTKAFWIGDQNTTWDDKDGIKTVLPALLSGGLSGYSVDHIDAGGWLSLNFPLVSFRRDKELFLRWFELGVMTPLLRVHNTNQPERNWQLDSDPDTLSRVAALTRLFRGLAPYRQVLLQEAQRTGMPLIRHSMLVDPQEKTFRELDSQMFLGDDLLFAPVLDQGKNEVSLLLPRGQWRHLWSGEIFGSEGVVSPVRVAAPLGQPALFTRLGSPGERLILSGLAAP